MGHTLDINTSLRHLLFLLEYCMVTGFDWWDILLHVQPNMVQNLVEKLHEEYTRQAQALQQVTVHWGGRECILCLVMFTCCSFSVVSSESKTKSLHDSNSQNGHFYLEHGGV